MAQQSTSRLWSTSTLLEGVDLVSSRADWLRVADLSEADMVKELEAAWKKHGGQN